MDTYGVINKDLVHVDVSKTLRGAKCYATRNGFDKVSIRYRLGYIVDILFEKVGGKWIEYQPY